MAEQNKFAITDAMTTDVGIRRKMHQLCCTIHNWLGYVLYCDNKSVSKEELTWV